ncbi:MAG: hypothetical protein GWP70_13340 [Proteobacteria bacterium]|nr:hypothetical protein [Pseudomonadota bacterium]
MNVLQTSANQVVASQQETLERRLIVALLVETRLTMTQVARHAGLGDARALQVATRRLLRSSPSQLRSRSSVKADGSKSGNKAATQVEVELPISGAYDFAWVFNYLRSRALQGIEAVDGYCYQRRVSKVGEAPVWLQVTRRQESLFARLPLTCGPAHQLLDRVVRLFDLRADSAEIDQTLVSALPGELKQSAKDAPGLRVPGAWDGFETAVRAVLGQQVSVARGTQLANLAIAAYGGGDFPAPHELRHQEIAELGMPGNRGRAIATMAAWVADKEYALLEGSASEDFVQRIGAIKGIGPWTQNYMRLRLVKDADAFPHNDWVVLKQLQTTPAAALKLSQGWRPWRAYALMHIWRIAGLRRMQH